MKQHFMRRALVISTLGMLCFFAVAIYSPLHQHRNGDPKQCSLNNIEYQVADSVAPVLDVPRPSNERALLPAEILIALPPTRALEQGSRGPPSSSRSS